MSRLSAGFAKPDLGPPVTPRLCHPRVVNQEPRACQTPLRNHYVRAGEKAVRIAGARITGRLPELAAALGLPESLPRA